MTHQTSGPEWRTSSYTERQDCVELAFLGADSVGIRDSKNPSGPYLTIAKAELGNLIGSIKAGELDLA